MPSLKGVRIAVLMLGLAATWACAARSGAKSGSMPAVNAAPVQIAQAPGPGGGPPAPMSEAERTKMRQQMLERMLEQSGLTDREKAAAKKTLQAKEQARDALAAELTKLRRVANEDNPSAKALQDALAAYRAALAQYHKKIAAEDAALVEQLSLAGQVRCMSLGVLDNGMGPMGPAGGPGAGQSGGPGFGPPPSGFGPPR